MKIFVEFDIELSPHLKPTRAEIKEWLRFELNDNGEMSPLNPLAGQSIEPVMGSLMFTTEEE